MDGRGREPYTSRDRAQSAAAPRRALALQVTTGSEGHAHGALAGNPGLSASGPLEESRLGSETEVMKSRLAKLIAAELLAFGAFVFGGLAVFGGASAWSGASRHPTVVTWTLVAMFGVTAILLALAATERLLGIFRPRDLNRA